VILLFCYTIIINFFLILPIFRFGAGVWGATDARLWSKCGWFHLRLWCKCHFLLLVLKSTGMKYSIRNVCRITLGWLLNDKKLISSNHIYFKINEQMQVLYSTGTVTYYRIDSYRSDNLIGTPEVSNIKPSNYCTL
jgi:hypothetical protein